MKKFYFIPLFLLLFSAKMYAQPAGWAYSAPYQVVENSGTLVTNYQAKLTINTQALIGAGQMLANGNDIRFGKNCNGSILYNYWIESGINTASTVIWVKIDTLFPSATRTFYMFYGNASASTVSAIQGTFNGPMSATDSTANTSLSGSANAQRGFRFAPTEDILVTAFGKSEPSANPRTVTLFNFATQAVLSQQVVNGPSAQWSYQNIPSPIWMTQGTQYLLEIFFPAGDDAYYYGASPTVGQHIFYFDMRYCNGCTPNTFPTSSVSGMLYGYVDMWYWTKNNVSPAPTISTGTVLTYNALDVSFCSGDSVLAGTTATGGTGPYSYSWSPATGLSSPTSGTTYASPAATTSYTVTITDNTGCVTTDNVTVTVNQLPIVSATAINDSICPGDTAMMYATGTAFMYIWQPGNIMAMTWPASPSVTTNYTVTGTDGNGCSTTTTQMVTVTTPPSVSITGNYSFACSNAINQLTLTGNGAATYDWNSGAGTGTTFNDTPTASETYTVVGTDAFGCSDTANYSVTILQAPVASASASDDSICPGTCVTVTGTATGGNPPYVYNWSPNTTTSSFTVCPTTTTCYTLTVMDGNGCMDNILYCVNVDNSLNVVSTGPSAICLGDSATLFASGPGIATISWTPSSSLNPSTGFVVDASPSVTTTYTVVATSFAGCSDTTTQTLIVNQLPSVAFTSSLNTICLDDAAATLSGGSPAGGTYTGPGVSGTTFTPMTAGNGTHSITYTYTDGNNCSATATDNVVVDPCTGVNETNGIDGVSVFPNPFSTLITINRIATDEVTVNIFDAEGRLVMSKQTSGTKIEIETAALANGIYSLQLIDATGTKTFRIAKNN